MKAACCACVLAILLGCGGGSGSSTPTAPEPAYPSIAGNWSITASSQVTSATVQIGAYLSNANGAVSGIAHVLNSPCYQLTANVPVSGTITPGGAVSLTSSAVDAQTITMSGTISGSSVASGSYSIAGGCAGGDKGTATGYLVPSFTGTWTGNFSLASGAAATVTVQAVQSGPDASGMYEVTGTVAFSGSPCLVTGTITSSAISGSYFAVTISDTAGDTVDFVGGLTDATGRTISGSYLFTSGACAGASGSGSLGRS